VTAQAEMTSTYGHPRLNWPVMGRTNSYDDSIFACRQSEKIIQRS